MTTEQLKLSINRILNAARDKTVVVFGDLMLDEWIIGSTSRISPEAPVPVVCFSERRTAPGGAANVATNLLALGSQVRVCGVTGDDEAGRDLKRELSEAGAAVDGVVIDATRPTTLKTRIVAQRQQMVRVDRESDAPFSRDLFDLLCERFGALLQGSQVLCLSDYDKGVASGGAITALLGQARSEKILITGGPKPHNLSYFAGADFLSFNEKEASAAAGIRFDSEKAIERAGEGLREAAQARALAVTRGGRGVLLFEQGKTPRSIEAHEVEVFDVAGAGDTFLAAATLALAGGADFVEAASVGNLAAAASVRHVGVVAVKPADVLRIAQEPDTHE